MLMQIPDYSRWHCPVFSYNGLSDFLAVNVLPNGIHNININGHHIDFLLNIKPTRSDTLLIVFGGAVNRQFCPPFFSGLTISTKTSASLMAINDPSIYLDSQINIAWYAGSRFLPLQSLLPSVIDKVASLCASRIIMTGGSGGGFASLYYATRTTKPAIAFVYNPQTDITKYKPKPVQYYVDLCFDGHGDNPEAVFSNITYNLVKHYSETPAPVIYFQNDGDWHIQCHTIPFLKNVYGIDWSPQDHKTEGLFFHLDNWGKGHVAPPGEYVAYIVQKLCDAEGSWYQIIQNAPKFVIPPCLKLCY